MNLYEKFGTDGKAETEGVRIEIEGAVFIVRRAGGHNRAFRYAVARHAKPYQGQFDELQKEENARRASEVEEEINRKAFADEVVIGWEHVDGPDGKPMEFTRENFLHLTEACPDVWDILQKAALDIENFRKKDGEKLGER